MPDSHVTPAQRYIRIPTECGTIPVGLCGMTTLKPIFHCDAKYLASGIGVGQCPRRQNFRWGYQHVGILEPNANPKFALPPTPTPDASQWNIGGVGYQMQNFCIGHVHFMFLCSTFAFGTQRKPSFQWNMGFKALAMRIHLYIYMYIFIYLYHIYVYIHICILKS